MSLDGFVGVEIELGVIFVGKSRTRGVVAIFNGHQPCCYDEESCGHMEIADKGFDAG